MSGVLFGLIVRAKIRNRFAQMLGDGDLGPDAHTLLPSVEHPLGAALFERRLHPATHITPGSHCVAAGVFV